jgi:uncharacterized protein
MSNLQLFHNKKPIIGMVHLLPLPGSPGYQGDMEQVIHRAKADADALVEADYDGLIVENFSDLPYLTGSGPLERTVAFTIVLREIRNMVSKPLGVNIQFNDYEAEILTAGLCKANFVRIEAYVDSLTTVGGITPACSARAHRLKSQYGFKDLAFFVDVHVKEASLIGSSTFAESIRNAEHAGADAIIVTGTATGQATPVNLVQEARKNTKLDLLIGSGFNKEYGKELLIIADGAIVGSSIKIGGKASNPIDPLSAKELIAAVRGRE